MTTLKFSQLQPGDIFIQPEGDQMPRLFMRRDGLATVVKILGGTLVGECPTIISKPGEDCEMTLVHRHDTKAPLQPKCRKCGGTAAVTYKGGIDILECCCNRCFFSWNEEPLDRA